MRDAALSGAADIETPRAERLASVGILRQALLPLAVAAGVFWLGFENGSYDVTQWTTVAIVVWWTIVVGLAFGIWRVEHVPRSGRLVFGFLLSFAAVTGLSALWATGADRPFLAMSRVLLYAGVVALTMLIGTRTDLRRWSDGIALGLVLVAALAFVSRLAPAHFPDAATLTFLPDAHARLSYPLGYWNGLAILVALSFPLLLRIAAAEHSAVVRALALLPLPLVGVTIYLASSRTGAFAAGIGITAFAALANRRGAAAGAAVAAVAGSALAIAFTAQQDSFVNGTVESASALHEGRRVAAVVVLLGLASAFTYVFLSGRLAAIRPSRSATLVAGGAIAAVVVVGTIAAHPVRRWQNFTRPPSITANGDFVQSHFLSTNGNWRWQYWRSAVDEFRTRPLAGRGAGSFEAWWSEHGKFVGFIGNAHSLYVEVLGELGLLGLLLLVCAFGVGSIAGVRRAREDGAGIDDAGAAVAAGFLAFAVAAGLDWMWELPAVSIVGMVFLGLAVTGRGVSGTPGASFGRAVGAGRSAARRSRLLRFGLVALGVAVIAVHLDLFTASDQIRASQRDVSRGDLSAATRAADRARTLQPWAAAPYVQLALIEEVRGRLHRAEARIEDAITRDDGDWRTWLIDVRIKTKLGDVSGARVSLDRARQLNPSGPAFLRTASTGASEPLTQ